MVLSIVILVVVTILTYAIWHYKQKYTVWTKQGVKGPTPLPLVGNFHRALFRPPYKVDQDDFTTYGPIFGSYTSSTPVLMVSDPEHIKLITIKDAHIFPDRLSIDLPDKIGGKFLSVIRGERWRSGRKVITPVFTTGKLKKMYHLMDLCVGEALEALDGQAKDGLDLDLKRFWGCYTLSVIAKCCFATNINTYKEPDSDFMKHVRAFFETNFVRTLLLFTLPAAVSKRLKISFMNSEAIDFFSQLVTHLMRKRETELDNYPNDFLKLLMDAKEEAEKEDSKLTELLDEDFVKAQCILFFAAGYETTASLLTFATYSLAVNPDIQDKLFNELLKIKQSDGSISYDDLMTSKYLDAFVSETLRMYPPVGRIERSASEDYILPGTDIVVPKKASVGFSVYAVHHDPKNYLNPDKFDPERFMPENSDTLVPHTYLPFGSGPRNCVAMRFALLEAKLVLAKSLLRYEFVKSAKTQVPLEFENANPFMKPKSALIGVRRR